MSRPVVIPGHSKAIVGVAKVIRFIPPVPISGTPTYSVNYRGVDLVASAASSAFGAAPTVNAIGADRQTLTMTISAAGLAGMVGDRGGIVARLVGAAYGSIPVKVADISGTSIRLADRLPTNPTVDADVDTLELRGWSATLTTVAVTAIARRNVRVLWEYTADLGADYGNEVHRFRELLHVVPHPFAIDLHQEHVFDLAPSYARWIPQRQQSWVRQILAAERRIVLWLRQNGYEEDQLNGGDFIDAAAHMAVSLILRGRVNAGASLTEAADAAEAKALELFTRTLDNVQWHDANNDGGADEGEENLDLRDAAMSEHAGGFMNGGDTDYVAADFPAFTRNSDH